jgi:hypothetical protein
MIAIEVIPSSVAALVMSDSQAEESSLEAQSVTALETSLVASAKSEAAFPISWEHLVYPPPQSVTALEILVVAVPSSDTTSAMSDVHVSALSFLQSLMAFVVLITA